LERVLARFDFDPRLSDDDITELKSSEEFMRAARIIKGRVDIATFLSPVPLGPPVPETGLPPAAQPRSIDVE